MKQFHPVLASCRLTTRDIISLVLGNTLSNCFAVLSFFLNSVEGRFLTLIYYDPKIHTGREASVTQSFGS